jgi:pilus assembly protein CpaC
MTRTVALSAVVAAMLAAPAWADDEATLSLAPGIQKVLNVPNIARVAVGDPSVADVKPLGASQLIVSGQAEGNTTLMIWKSNGARLSYVVSVRRHDLDKVLEEEALLGEMEGVTLRRVGERVYIEGCAYTTEDFERVKTVAGLYGHEVVSLVKIAPNAKRLLANRINSALERAGLKNIQVNVVGTTLFLEGSVESQEDYEKALRIVKAMNEP